MVDQVYLGTPYLILSSPSKNSQLQLDTKNETLLQLNVLLPPKLPSPATLPFPLHLPALVTAIMDSPNPKSTQYRSHNSTPSSSRGGPDSDLGKNDVTQGEVLPPRIRKL